MVPVPDADGKIAEGVRALDVLMENLRLTRYALNCLDDLVITAGGDCGVELAPVAAARARHGDQLMVLWIDAHPDVSTPQTLPSGSFHGMVLRTLLGDGPAPLVPEEPLSPAQVILAGVRSYETGQQEYILETGIRHYPVDQIERALDDLTGPVYLHVDLDVLDPTEFASTCYPEPDGVAVERLIDLASRVESVVGAGITEHAPPADANLAGDANVVRRIGAALRR
jgi:arginase